MLKLSLFPAIVLLLMPLFAQAAEQAGLAFSHNDWEIVCDNTRTCRAAGYQSDQDELTVSVLLTRKAGTNESVAGRLMIGDYDNESLFHGLPEVFKPALRINGQDFGAVNVEKATLIGELSAAQIDALLAALRRDSTIEWVLDNNRWHLSDKGAAAVLLKMDEFQERLGTRGALIKKGGSDEKKVLPPVPPPLVKAVAPVKALPGDETLLAGLASSDALLQALRANTKESEDCPELAESEVTEIELSVYRLTKTKLLVSAMCWRAAYNFGQGYWMIGAEPPFRPVSVTFSGSEYSDGRISAAHKGRGLGDCWSADDWTWDGKQFVHTASSTTGMCKLVAPGGAWTLPTLVTDVR